MQLVVSSSGCALGCAQVSCAARSDAGRLRPRSAWPWGPAEARPSRHGLQNGLARLVLGWPSPGCREGFAVGRGPVPGAAGTEQSRGAQLPAAAPAPGAAVFVGGTRRGGR